MTATDEPVDAGLLAHPGVMRVREQLEALGATGQIRILDDAARTAAQAAALLGVEPAQIANSLVFAAHYPDDPDAGEQARTEPVLVLTSGGHRVDVNALAARIDAERVGRADPELVRSHTGFAIGGVPPIGHLQPMRTFVDVTLARHDVVWAAAGHPHAVFPTTYEELLRISAGQPVEVA